MSEPTKIDTDKLLKIIGEQTVNLHMMSERIQSLAQQIAAYQKAAEERDE